MLRRLALLLAVLLGLGALVAPPAGAKETGTIIGRFVDEYGVAVNDLTVQVWGSEQLRTTRTRADGTFTLAPVTSSWAITFDWYDQGPYYQFPQQTWYGGATDPDEATTFTIDTQGVGGTFDAGTIVLRATLNPGTSSRAIDTSNREAVRSAYVDRLRPQLVDERDLRPRGCTVAGTPRKTQRRTIRAVNVMRALAGLDPVRLSPGLSRAAQRAALIQHHQGFLSHGPSPSARCYTKSGGRASGRSNLAQGYEGARAILGYMTDPGPGNTVVGHRRWVLDPYTQRMGSGQVGRFQALYVMGKSSTAQPTPRYLTWPTAGWFPRQLEPRGRWSFSATRSGDLSLDGAVVAMVVDGRSVEVKQYPAAPGYGSQSTLVWDVRNPAELRKARTAIVSVGGLTQRGVALPTYSYTVNLFKAR